MGLEDITDTSSAGACSLPVLDHETSTQFGL
jgi:hypothetical protein